MLGCHDFCGYYEWTFHHIRQTFGPRALHDFWASAIGADSQRAYVDAATRAGLRGLLDVWTKTGDDEQCDWTFTLDEQKSVLRWDMRDCPSKGFLIDNDLSADEDYCDHCMGWIAPTLAGVGVEVARHEHNHRGQCWAEMRLAGNAYIPLNLPIDIRHDVAWNAGYVDVFVNGQRVTADPCDVLVDHLAACDSVEAGRQVMIDKQWLTAPDPVEARALLLGDDAQVLSEVAVRWRATPEEHRPLLLHAYFPRTASPDFASVEIPRPVPLLPVLIRAAVYTHAPGADHPSVDEQAELVAAAIRLLRGTARHSNH
jgi:hypothetical protein